MSIEREKAEETFRMDQSSSNVHILSLHGLWHGKLTDRIRTLLSGISTVMTYPIRLAGLSIIFYCNYYFIGYMGINSLVAIIGLIIVNSPIEYLVAKELWRQAKMLPKSEAFEKTTEEAEKARIDYETMIADKERRKTKRV